MVRDIPSDPLPQGCPFSFVNKLERNQSAPDKPSKQAILGALRYKSCEIPEEPADQLSREIKDWFAFALDEKTTGLWGYFNEADYSFKVTAGGKKEADPLDPSSETEGKDQTLLEMWNEDGYGLTHYVNQGDGDANAEGTKGKKQSGFYYYSPGAVDYSQLFVTDSESSMWGFTVDLWQYKLAAESNSTIFQIWKGANGTSEDPPAGYAKMYAYDEAGGFSCSLSDDISSTLEPSSLYCIDKSETDVQGKYYAGGANIWEDGIYTQIDPSSIWCFESSGSDAKFYAGGATMTTGGGYTQIDGSTINCSTGGEEGKFYAGGATMTNGGNFTEIDGSTVDCWAGGSEGKYYAGGAYITDGSTNVQISPPSKNAYFQSITFVDSDGKIMRFEVLCTAPEEQGDVEFAKLSDIAALGINASCDLDGSVNVELTGQPIL